jgi:ferrochelatase
VTTLPPDAGVLLMTYGSPDSLEEHDIAAYLARVRGGRDADPELVTEFTRRYRVIGGSPLIGITTRLAAGLTARLGRPARAAMRFSEPSIETGLCELVADGARHVVAIVLSPQYSSMLMGGYRRAVDEARTRIGADAPNVTMAGEWWSEPSFVRALAGRVRDKLDRLPGTDRATVTVLLTAHSLPRRVAEQEPAYVDQLRGTAAAVAKAAGLSPDQWQFCWQSAGHEPGEWMTPDLKDLVVDLAAARRRSILVVPVQFLADHLEVLYDIDVGAREQAEAAGAHFDRIDSLNDDTQLIEALAHVAETTAFRRFG